MSRGGFEPRSLTVLSLLPHLDYHSDRHLTRCQASMKVTFWWFSALPTPTPALLSFDSEVVTREES